MLLAPQWLWLFIVIIYMYIRQPKRSRYAVYMYIAVSMVILALSRPVYNAHSVALPVHGSDVIVALDLSYSMQAQDLKPNRLDVAKQLLATVVTHDFNDRFGVLAFTSNAIILSPLTRESELLLHLVHRIDERMVITKGTSLLPALKLARSMSHAKRPKVLLFTDGGDADSYADAAAFAQDNHLQVSIVMLATPMGTTLPLEDGTLLKDRSGKLVVTAENRAIEAISRATGGAYLVQPDAATLITLLQSQYRDDFSAETTLMQYGELFYLCIAVALFFFMLAHTYFGSMVHVKIAALLLLLLGTNTQAGVLDAYHLYRAKAAYRQEHYLQAARHFLHVDSAEARYNAAVAEYQSGAYENALALFESIASNQVDFKAKLYYNRAICNIRLKAFERARENLVKSLTLKFDREAYENWRHIYNATRNSMPLPPHNKAKRHDEDSSASSDKHPAKEGGSSNMNVAASASSGSSDSGAKTHAEAMLSFSQNRVKLSSKQYELINQRGVHETTPW